MSPVTVEPTQTLIPASPALMVPELAMLPSTVEVKMLTPSSPASICPVLLMSPPTVEEL
jgi:hypothetical protein